jgi:hypothetical protein
MAKVQAENDLAADGNVTKTAQIIEQAAKNNYPAIRNVPMLAKPQIRGAEAPATLPGT